MKKSSKVTAAAGGLSVGPNDALIVITEDCTCCLVLGEHFEGVPYEDLPTNIQVARLLNMATQDAGILAKLADLVMPKRAIPGVEALRDMVASDPEGMDSKAVNFMPKAGNGLN